jgi:hypothetical protein
MCRAGRLQVGGGICFVVWVGYSFFMDRQTRPDQKGDGADEERDRRITNIFLAVFFVVIVGSGLWLVNAMVEQRALDECISSGRRNCAPIDAPPR